MSCDCSSYSNNLTNCQKGGGGGVYTGRPHIRWPPIWKNRGDPPSCRHSNNYTHGGNCRHGSGGALTRCAVCSPSAARLHRSLPPACLRCLPARSDAVIAPCAADREPLSPPAPSPPPTPHPGSSPAGCRGGSADVEPATQRSSPVGKHRRRRWNVFPVTFRTFSALRAPSSPPLATPKVGWDAEGGGGLWVAYFERVTWMFRLLLRPWHIQCACVQKLRLSSCRAANPPQICHSAWSCWSHSQI